MPSIQSLKNIFKKKTDCVFIFFWYFFESVIFCSPSSQKRSLLPVIIIEPQFSPLFMISASHTASLEREVEVWKLTHLVEDLFSIAHIGIPLLRRAPLVHERMLQKSFAGRALHGREAEVSKLRQRKEGKEERKKKLFRSVASSHSPTSLLPLPPPHHKWKTKLQSYAKIFFLPLWLMLPI